MMDFGPEAETKPKSKAKPKKLTLLTAILIISFACVGLYLLKTPKNPLPVDVKSQVSYKTIYPTRKTDVVDISSYSYQPASKTLSFNIQSSGTKVVFTEQPAPGNLSSNGQAYYPALGVHPYAQFQSKLGPVALAKFYQTGNLKAVGQSAILATQGTLVIAHTDKELTNAQWKDLFDSLKITK